MRFSVIQDVCFSSTGAHGAVCLSALAAETFAVPDPIAKTLAASDYSAVSFLEVYPTPARTRCRSMTRPWLRAGIE